jgi:transmembrane sensor
VARSVSDSIVHEEAAGWLVRLNAAPNDVTTYEAFEDWRDAAPEHRAAFDAVQDSWALFGEQAAAPELLALRRDALGRTGRWLGRGLGRGRGLDLGRRGLAAGLAALVLAPLAVHGWRRLGPDARRTLRTAVGEQRTVTLSDGSRVSLDANTLVKVAYSPALRLAEVVEGRAHFEVAKDKARPMRVRAGRRTVTALGTAFTVEHEGERVVVTLVEGRVAVTETARARGVAPPAKELVPQQQLVFAADAAPRVHEAVDVERAMAWREGKLVFDDESLADAAARVNNYSRVKIVVEDAPARALKVSGIFNAGDTPAFVEAVQSYFPVDVSTGDSTIQIRSRS